MASLERVTRQTSIDRAGGDGEAGRFSGILASEGEASDGHIIAIKGVEIPAQVPLLRDHDRSADGNLGSWVPEGFRRTRDGILRGVAQIELEGEGAHADFRRDVALMVERGHIRSFSAGIVATERPTARVNLPKDHPAFIDAGHDGAERFGVFMAKSRLEEGSIVTLGADPASKVGRALEGPEGVRSIWAGLLVGDDLQSVLKRALEAVELAETLGATESQILQALDFPAEPQAPTGGPPDPETKEREPLAAMLKRVVEEERGQMRRQRGGLLSALRGK